MPARALRKNTWADPQKKKFFKIDCNFFKRHQSLHQNHAQNKNLTHPQDPKLSPQARPKLRIKKHISQHIFHKISPNLRQNHYKNATRQIKDRNKPEKNVWKHDDSNKICQNMNKNPLKRLKGYRQNWRKNFAGREAKFSFIPNQNFPFSI